MPLRSSQPKAVSEHRSQVCTIYISHASSDEAAAVRLCRALSKFRLPRRLADEEMNAPRHPLRATFPDPVHADVGELTMHLQLALQDAHALVVICSPQAARSPRVEAEICFFQRLGKEDKVFAYIIDGEPNANAHGRECFPPPLRIADKRLLQESASSEVLAADARPGHGGRHAAFLKLVAGLLGMNLSRLTDRATRRLRKRRVLQLSAAFGAVAGAAVGLVLWDLSQNNQARALAREAISLLDNDPSDASRSARRLAVAAAARQGFRSGLLPEVRAALGIAWSAPGSDHAPVELKAPNSKEWIAAAFPSPLGDRLFSVDRRGNAVMWSLHNQQPLFSLSGSPWSITEGRLAQTLFDPTGERIVLVDRTDAANVHDATTGEKLFSLCEPRATRRCYINADFAAFGPSSEWIVLAGLRGVELWSAKTGKRQWFAGVEGANSATFDSSAKRVAIMAGGKGYDRAKIVVLETESSKEICHADLPEGSPGDFRTFAFSRDGSQFLLAAESLGAFVWSADTCKALLAATGASTKYDLAPSFQETEHVANAAFAGRGGQVLIWGKEPAAGYMVSIVGAALGAPMRVPEGDVDRLAVSPNGRLAAIGIDHVARLWDLQDATEIARFTSHGDEPIEDIRFMPDGRSVITAGRDATIRIWQLPPDQRNLADEVCKAIPPDQHILKAHELNRWAETGGLVDPCANVQLGSMLRPMRNLLATLGF